MSQQHVPHLVILYPRMLQRPSAHGSIHLPCGPCRYSYLLIKQHALSNALSLCCCKSCHRCKSCRNLAGWATHQTVPQLPRTLLAFFLGEVQDNLAAGIGKVVKDLTSRYNPTRLPRACSVTVALFSSSPASCPGWRRFRKGDVSCWIQTQGEDCQTFEKHEDCWDLEQ